jgi:HK97 family phage portal protein
MVDQGDGSEPQDLYKSVAWAFWCANLRADSVAQIPYGVYPQGSDEDTPEAEVTWEHDLTAMLWQVEMWLCLNGAAYVLKQATKRRGLLGLQVLNANSMKVLEHDNSGPTVFRQQVGVDHKDFPADQILYFRTFSPSDDIGPGVASGSVGSVASDLVKNSNQWASSFFANGAIPAVVLSSEQMIKQGDRDDYTTRWNKMLQGAANAFKTIVLGGGLKPTVIGHPIKDLAMPDLERTKREQILAAHKIPPGLAEAKTNRAERDALQFEFWTQCIKPEVAIHIRPVLDDQLFNPLGYRIGFHYREIEAIQRAEIAKAESTSFVVEQMLAAYEANTVSIDETRAVIGSLLEWLDLPALEATFEPEERTPLQLAPAAEEEPGAPEVPEPKAITADLDKWERKAIRRLTEGRVDKAIAFASDTISPQTHSLVVYGLERAVTLQDVRDVFAGARGEYKAVPLIAEGADDPPIPIPADVVLTEDDMDTALALWDRKMPDYAGLLDAEVINKQRYEDAGSVAVG